MTEKELKRLSRADLLEILIDQSLELEKLKRKLEETENALWDKQLKIDRAGSIAEASLQLNGVFEAIEAAGKQYLDNIQTLSERQEKVCAQMEEESMKRASQLLEEAQKRSTALEEETKVECAEMVEKAKAESQRCWDEVSEKLEQFYNEHVGLKELLSIISNIQKRD